MKSSSGGIFFYITQSIIKAEGVVFDVQYNTEWRPVYTY